MKAKEGLSATTPKVVRFDSTITIGSTVINVPSAQVTFSPFALLAGTACAWTTVIPPSCDNKNAFLAGVLFSVPAAITGSPSVTWAGTFTMPAGFELQWQWAAAVYTVCPGCIGLGVKPTDANLCSLYLNSDKAGTPESIKAFVTGGARGGGGSNFTGSLSGTASVACT